MIGIISDTHIGMKSNNEVMLKCSAFLVDEIIMRCKERNVTKLFHLGDFFDDRQSINVKSSDVGQYFIETLEEAGIEFVIVGGNHDFYYKKSKKVSSLNIFRRYNVEVVKNPKVIEVEGNKVLLCPWLSTQEEYDALQELAYQEGEKYICLGHFEIKGYLNNDFHRSYSGMDPEVMKKFRGVYSGHFHKRQTKDNITYVGSTLQKDHGETSQEKGITFLNLDDLSEEFFEFQNVPKHHTIICDVDLLKSPAKILNEKYADDIAGNFIRLNIIGIHDGDMVTRVEMELLNRKALEVKRNLCMSNNGEDWSGEESPGDESELLELGNPVKLHMKYVNRPEFFEKWFELYGLKMPVLMKIIGDLYKEVYALRGEEI